LPETADTFTFGFVITPLDDLSINIDYFSYEIEDTIGSFGASGILGACYYSTNRSRCDKIERNSGGLIQNIYSTTTNIGGLTNNGVDIKLDYGIDTGFGRFDFGVDFTSLDEYSISSPTSDGLGTAVTQCVDVYDCGVVIDGKFVADVSWFQDKMSARLRFLSYPSFEECSGDNCNNETSSRRQIERVTYVSAGFGYDFEQGTRLRLNISNLLDEEPPRIFNAFYSAADVSYDFMGRYINLTLIHNFQ
jgi:outer membrane receptor protein involved in Fe transport